MALLNIVTVPDGVLRRKARKVTDFDQDFQTLAENMIETMRAAPGVGLAAPQVGISQRLIVVEYQEEDDEGAINDSPKKLFIVANPEIIKGSDEKEMGIEGCLSIPGLVGEVERSLAVVIKGQNRRGQPLKFKAEGWLAKNAIVVTALNPVIGYASGAALVKEALARHSTIRELALEKAQQGELIHVVQNRPVTAAEITEALSDLRRLTEGGIVGGNAGG